MKYFALVLAFGLSVKGFASVTVVQNVSPDAVSWPGTPIITTMANPSSASTSEGFNGGGGSTNLSQTFTVPAFPAGHVMRTISIYAGGGTGTGSGTNVTLNLYDLGTNQTGTNSYTTNITGSNLLGSGAGLAISYSNQPNGVLQFDFEGEDQIPLQAGHIYAFELCGVAATTPVFWRRVTSDVHSGGAAYRNQSRIVLNNTGRDFAMAIYTNHAELPPPPPPVLGQCTLNWNDVRQRIDGFGASSAWRGTSLNAAQANLFFSTNNGIGLSLLRNRIQPNVTVSAAEQSMMAQAQARGAKVWSAPWTPPPVYKDSGVNNGGNFISSVDNYQNYASQMANYVVTMKNAGINLEAISVQNEPDHNDTGYESCVWTAQQIRQFVPYLYNALVASNVASTKIMIAESQNWSANTTLYTATMNDPSVAPMVGIIANHNYDGTATTTPPSALNSYGKPLWETEVSILTAGSSDPTIANGLYWANRIHQFMTVAQANAYHYWWLISGNGTPNQGLVGGDLIPTKRLYVFGQYSRFVRPGFYRVGISGITSFALVSCYKDPATSTFVIVAINLANPPVDYTFNLNGFSTASVTPWITSSTQSLASQPAIAVTNSSSFTYRLPPMSVVTLVGQAIPARPALNVAEQTGNLVLSWPTNATGYSLQFSTDPASLNWNPVLPLPAVIGGQNVVTNAITNGAAFYRLNKQ